MASVMDTPVALEVPVYLIHLFGNIYIFCKMVFFGVKKNCYDEHLHTQTPMYTQTASPC